MHPNIIITSIVTGNAIKAQNTVSMIFDKSLLPGSAIIMLHIINTRVLTIIQAKKLSIKNLIVSIILVLEIRINLLLIQDYSRCHLVL